ncbi:ecto-ADP-ribosyltransferase 5-like isoform X2 [Pseudophryne corroboree]|uniref:ecto-ADP-ribosyltransferase 5-like isoform X2 n=1 Tax=Pseudophryne corroboree TaxID=495146 RepID=UPI003081A3AC
MREATVSVSSNPLPLQCYTGTQQLPCKAQVSPNFWRRPPDADAGNRAADTQHSWQPSVISSQKGPFIMNLLFLASVILCPDIVGHADDFPDHCDAEDGGYIAAPKSRAGKKSNTATQTPLQTNSLWPKMECNLLNLDLVPNAFDDQYKGCSEIMETDVMPKVLTQEKALSSVFNTAWNCASVQWNKVKATVHLPSEFRDEFGIAIAVYTTDWPKDNPIYKVFNGNVSLAGRSRGYYMQNFHFKALHFYLTRALQVLKKNSRRRHRVYRGTEDSYHVSEAVLRFGRFTSSSLDIEVAKEYYEGLFFNITTCFGVNIHKISSFPKEREILIPVAEKFHYVGKEGNIYILNSTCELCSYFNCAYLGAI